MTCPGSLVEINKKGIISDHPLMDTPLDHAILGKKDQTKKASVRIPFNVVFE
jgi:hypothetical protein